jgi:hypothetical protein
VRIAVPSPVYGDDGSKEIMGVVGLDARPVLSHLDDDELPFTRSVSTCAIASLVDSTDHRHRCGMGGLFAMTPDSLPYIGPPRYYPGHWFALGYGGNGMPSLDRQRAAPITPALVDDGPSLLDKIAASIELFIRPGTSARRNKKRVAGDCQGWVARLPHCVRCFLLEKYKPCDSSGETGVAQR